MSHTTNISRPNSKRWLFTIRIRGEKHSKNFYDTDFGGKQEALQAALLYKQQIYKKYNLGKKGREATGPMKGVSRTASTRELTPGKKRTDAYWQAVWVGINGKQETARFSIPKHGEEKAKKLAIRARKNALEAIKRGYDPRFIQPHDKYAKLWRYMDFTKLLSLLEDSAIFFSCAKYFEDPYEGLPPKGNTRLRNFVQSKSRGHDSAPIPTADKEKIAISCWHLSKHESAAMWKLYGKGDETVCITTKFSKLRNQLITGAQVGVVKYVDFNTTWVPENNPYYPYMYKRKSFEHEKEVRAIIDMDKIKQEDLLLRNQRGYKNKVNLNVLVDEVYVAPDASDWFFDLVKKIISHYGIKANVIRSQLLSLP